MLKPVGMKKITAVILEEKKDPVLRELKEHGMLQFMDAAQSELFQEMDLGSASPSGAHVKASELLSRINNILDSFRVLEKGKSFLRGLIPPEVEKAPVEECPPEVFFENIKNRLNPIEKKIRKITAGLERLKKEKEDLKVAEKGVVLLEKIGVSPKDLRGYKKVRVYAGTIPEKELEALEDDLAQVAENYILVKGEADKKILPVLIVTLKDQEEVGRHLRLRRFEEFQFPMGYRTGTLKEVKSKLEETSKRIKEEEEKLLKELQEVEKEEKLNLLRMKELLQIEKYLDEASHFFGKTSKTYLLKAWVPALYVDRAVDVIRKAAGGYSTISVEDPEEKEEPPTMLGNPGFATPVELLTNTYGTPPYRKIDPTLMMTISFPVMFGFMFGDIGQGLILALIGFFIGFYLKLDEVYRRFGRIIFYCGLAAIMGGFLYGSIFGLEGEALKHYLGIELHPLWLSPLNDVSTLITFALYVGLVQLSLGCVLNIINNIKHNPLEALFSPWGAVGLWLFWGGAFLLKKHGTDVFAFFRDQLIIPTIVVPLIIIAIGVKYAEKTSFGWGIYASYEAITRYLFNSISYIRVIALALVHAALSSVMVMLMLQFPGGAPVTFLLGNLLIFVMEAVISFIQTLRLHYYEWFSKFYEGSGRAFEAFKVVRRYTSLAPLQAPG
jgi:V/A-type H+-transporting ATPase subunit I